VNEFVEHLVQAGGPRPERRSSVLIVVAPIRMPSLHSSPWMQHAPSAGSRARRSASSRILGSSEGRPERRRW
jgi:hypothetical protein